MGEVGYVDRVIDSYVTEKLCEERHKQTAIEIENLKKGLTSVTAKVDSLEQSVSEVVTAVALNVQAMNNTGKKVDRLTGAIWAVLITIFTLCAGFFIYAVEAHIFDGK